MRDIISEHALLGAVMVNPKQGGPALLSVNVEEFSAIHDQALASLLMDMLRREEHIDPITVHNEITARGIYPQQLLPSYLSKVSQACIYPPHAPSYAGQVREVYRQRAALATAQRLVARLDDAATDLALADLDSVIEVGRHSLDLIPESLERTTSTPPMTLEELLMTKAEFDWLVPGLLERCERLMLTGQEGMGKALALDTAIATPKGWTTMGALSVGDEVFGTDGAPTVIVAATDVLGDRPCYRVIFSDGTQIVADAEHQWLTETLAAREHRGNAAPAVATTEQIRGTLWARNGHTLNHSIEVAKPLQYPAQELPIQPYTLGAWLGDGTSRSTQITNHPKDSQILDEIQAEGYEVRAVGSQLQHHISNSPDKAQRIETAQMAVASGASRSSVAAHYGISRALLADVGAGARSGGGWHPSIKGEGLPVAGYVTLQEIFRRQNLLQNKHIPTAYLESSVGQRLSLLQGLMDTDGTVSANGAAVGRGSGSSHCTFSVVNERLARDTYELILGLGIKATFREGRAKIDGRDCGPCYKIGFQTDLPVFRLQRKLDRLVPLRTRRSKLRYITAVEPIASVPVRCIQVAAADHLFLAGRELVPTHNSVLLRQIAACLAAGLHPFTGERVSNGFRVLHVDAENGMGQSRRGYARMVDTINRYRPDPGWQKRLMVVARPDGLDLTGVDRAWWDRTCSGASPDVIITGPVYRLALGNPNSEEDVRKLVHVLDGSRVRHNAALLLEAHAGHGSSAPGAVRSMRPAGASLWLRWPENGLGLRRAKDSDAGSPVRMADLGRWRISREERAWPYEINSAGSGSGGLPWIPTDPRYDGTLENLVHP